MKRWDDVRELVNAAEENNWDLPTFEAMLDWEFVRKPLSKGGPSRTGLRPKRQMSAEARAKISAAQKKRWAKEKKADK